MAYCNKCGAQMGDDARFCTTCGADQGLIEQAEAPKAQAQYGQYQAPVQPAYTQPTYQQPAYAQPGYDARQNYAAKPGEVAVPPMSVWSYVGSLLLMGLPLAGFIITIVWACGGTSSVNRKNLARAVLILMAIGLVLSLIFGAVIASIAQQIVNELGGGFSYGF